MNITYENWAKQSIKTYSKSIAQKQVEKLYENVSGDISPYTSLIHDIISRVEVTSVLPYISSFIPTSTPTGKVPAFSLKYNGTPSQNVKKGDVVKVISVVDASSFVIDGEISGGTSGAVGTVLYKEANQLLVKVISNTFIDGENVDNITPFALAKTSITAIRSNVVGVGGLLFDYVGELTTTNGELKDNTSNTFSLEVNSASIDAKTAKIFTGLTVEFVQDLIAMYGEDAKSRLVNMLGNAISLELESRYFKFLKTIATQKSDIILSNSTALSLKDKYNDIISRIYKSIGSIGTNTNIAGQFFVVASSNVISAINSAGKVLPNAKYSANNSKFNGMLDGKIILIEDVYSDVDYMVVGNAGIDGFDNGIIFSPYLTDFIITTNPVTLQQEIAVINRYDIKRSPLDTKTIDGQSDFVELSVIDFQNLVNY